MKSSIFKFQTTSVTQKTFEREVSPLLQIKDAYPKMVLARIRDEAYQYEGIQIVDIADWLAEQPSTSQK